MARYNLGKLKIKASEDGISFRFGEGKTHRLGFGRKEAEPEYDYMEENYAQGEDYDSDYAAGEDYVPDGYSGRFARKADPEDDYDDGYADDDYAGGYDDYPEDQYDDGYADDYADEDDYYEEGDYIDDNGEYDDRYLDEDADAYGESAYAGESPLMQYVDENDWVTYLLLVLLPPLGIYLLWRRRRFEAPIRWGVSAASAIWFIIAIVLLFSLIFSGSGDSTANPPIEMPTPTATIQAVSTVEPDDLAVDITLDSLNGGNASLDDGDTLQPAATQDALAIAPTATPIAGGVAGTSTGDTVIMTSTGLYYHNNTACSNLEEGASISNVTTDVALNRGKTACPICYPNQETYYATSNGKYYHKTADCSNMKDAVVITKEAAKNQGKTECPVCIKQEVNSLDNTALKFATASTKDKSNMTVYATAGGRYFHVDATCGNMQDPVSGGLLKAMLAGKKACPTCCASADNLVWCTEGGKSYHNKQNCSKMENAYKVTLAEAMILGKSRCSVCWGQSTVGTSSGTTGGTVYVYGTKNGQYYHTNSTCSGMTGASRYTLKSMIASGKKACPTCCSGADTVVYATTNGAYYHSYASCSGMTDAQAGTLSQALAYGKSKCPNCWAGSDNGSSAILGETASGSYVYCTQNGQYYHVKSSCSGMTGASKVLLSTAVTAGKTACPSCAPAANYNVYSTQNGSYYHRTSSCSGMTGATQRTIEEAVVLGQAACPVCITPYLKTSSSGGISNVTSKTFSSAAATSSTYKSGKSGIKVYATSTSKHYHTTSSCSGMKNASRVTLETALNYGKTACSKCASSANTKVYAVRGGKYYHYYKSCAGSGAVQGKRAYALALGLDACPYCVTKTKSVVTSSWRPESGKFIASSMSAIMDVVEASSGTYSAGTSGLKVYASASGKYYHASKSCAGSSASKVTLETALNYGKKACPSCAASASKTVYSSSSDRYYHTSKAHAGSGAVSGTFAKALALGKKECPTCIGGSEAYEVSDIKYSAAGDTNVYIDLSGSMLYYHKNSSCSDAGLSNGTKVMLDFVVDWGFKACPFCNPPTSVK